jgi:CheY-like chemotaxis protein
MGMLDLSALVVEDEKLQSWSLAKSLAKWGFDVRAVYTGNEGVAQAEKSRYDVVLLDYQLPDIDGLEVARRVRQAQPDAVIFLVTAFQLSELPASGGLIDAYFNKPMDMSQLHQALKQLPKWQEAAQS